MRARLVVSCLLVVLLTALSGAGPAAATFPGRDGRIAFRRWLNADHTWGAIFTVRPDGTGERQITHPSRGHATTEPEWSADGRWITYWTGNEDTGRIWKIRADGTDRTFLSGTCTGDCYVDIGPSFAPSGRRITFSRAISHTPCDAKFGCFLAAIYTMRADGTDVRQVSQIGAPLDKHSRFEDNWPQWSPDGSRIAFERRDNRRRFAHAICTIGIDGTGLRVLTPWNLDAAQPDWSPDGRWILFRSHERGDQQNNLWMVRSNGTHLHRITNTFGGTYTWASYTFSPNGRRIVAARTPGDGPNGNADVYILSLDGQILRNVTHSSDWESAPDWGSHV